MAKGYSARGGFGGSQGQMMRQQQMQQKIMQMRFGLSGQKERTQKEVAEAIGISQSYISRLEKKIIRKLRLKLEAADHPLPKSR